MFWVPRESQLQDIHICCSEAEGEQKVSTLHRFSKQVYDSELCFFIANESGELFLALQTPLIWIDEDSSKNLLS